MASKDQVSQLLQRLEEISAKQDEYQKLFLARPMSKIADAASESVSVVDSVNIQGKHLEEMANMIFSVQVAVEQLADRVYHNERRMDDLEQYSRSNCLILHGCQNLPAKSSDNEVFENFVLNTLNDKLQIEPQLSNHDIDVCHALPSRKGKNPIIIKFVRRTVRNKVFAAKSKLKSSAGESNPRLALTESLTKRRLRLVEEARKIFEFRNVWTQKGLVYCEFMGQRHYIDDFSDIPRIRFPGNK